MNDMQTHPSQYAMARLQIVKTVHAHNDHIIADSRQTWNWANLNNSGEVYALIPKAGGRIGRFTLEIEGTVEEFKIYGMNSIWK